MEKPELLKRLENLGEQVEALVKEKNAWKREALLARELLGSQEHELDNLDLAPPYDLAVVQTEKILKELEGT